MLLEGSCHCRAVRFSLRSETPRPYMHCYCSICRKTAGGGGSAINLGGEAETLSVLGKRHLRTYRARLEDGSESPAERRFCGRCGSALWVWGPALAGAAPSLRIGHRHGAAGPARALSHHGRLRAGLGQDPVGQAGSPLPRLSRPVARGLAPEPRAARPLMRAPQGPRVFRRPVVLGRQLTAQRRHRERGHGFARHGRRHRQGALALSGQVHGRHQAR